MIHFEWPWVLLLLPLPALARRILPEASTDRLAALRTPFLGELGLAGGRRAPAVDRRAMLMAAAAWLLLMLAAARPQWSGEPIQAPVAGRDLMLAVDLSGSMEVEDFQLDGRVVDRLTATKSVASGFIRRRRGDRLGLILFGRNAYLQVPLTFDRTTVEGLLMESAIGLAGKETAIGDAIGLAVKRLRDKAATSRVLVLLTDGANTAGAVSPLKAATLAAQSGLKIYTIGIGADEMLVQSLLGARRVNPSRDLDEQTLRGIAERTGGRYFRARDTAELEQIYALLDELEPVMDTSQAFRPTASLFAWPLGAALALCFALLLERSGPFRRE
jgi:Ca-activated chloride channel family protein